MQHIGNTLGGKVGINRQKRSSCRHMQLLVNVYQNVVTATMTEKNSSQHGQYYNATQGQLQQRVEFCISVPAINTASCVMIMR